MAMALPKGMIRHKASGILWARKDVPRELRGIIGQTSLKASLRTKDVNDARTLFHGVMREFEARLASARKQLRTGKVEFPRVEISTEHLSPFMQASLQRAYEAKPENQIARLNAEIQTKLEAAKLIASTPETTSMEELFERWKRERKPRPNSEAEYRRAKDLFVRLNTDRPIAEYTSADARKFKDAILVQNQPNGTPLSHSSRVKWFGSVKTLFKLADGNDLLTSNPFAKITLERPKRTKENKRTEWEIEELRTLFGSTIYTDGERPRGGAGEASYWLPVLALYHGFRAGELCQLDTADVVKKGGIDCLSISPSAEDAGDAKSVKTDTSIRIVPIHSAVIALGFLDYVKSVKGKKLFPQIRQDSIGRWAGNWSKWFGRHRRDLGLGDRWKDFHSFRHGWKSAARGAGIPKEIHDEITGHDNNGDVGSAYGGVPIPKLKAELEKIKFSVKIPKWKAL